jgi:hypothetical protein
MVGVESAVVTEAPPLIANVGAVRSTVNVWVSTAVLPALSVTDAVTLWQKWPHIQSALPA